VVTRVSARRRIGSGKGTTDSRQEAMLRSDARSATLVQLVGAPFEGIAIEIVGPFPGNDRGNRCHLMAVDNFTKWPESYAIPTQEDSAVAETLVTDFCRFGIPRELHIDQGRNCESRLIRVFRRLGVSKICTTPLRPQSNGMVELYIRMVEEHLRKVVPSHQRDWNARLPNLVLAYRASIHDITGLTPASLVFGRELQLPCDPLFGAPPASNDPQSIIRQI
jgi:transposase InsO family protein